MKQFSIVIKAPKIRIKTLVNRTAGPFNIYKHKKPKHKKKLEEYNND